MSAHDELRKFITDLAVVRGQFVLSSGATSDWYLDMRRLTLDHRAAPLVGKVMNELTADWEFEAVGGLTMGADPIATAMMHTASRPMDAFGA
jgi:orotate phosphoribosyltransferase